MKPFRIALAAVLLAAFIAQVRPANASASVSSFSYGCDSANASGSTTAPYIVVEVYDPATQLDLYYGAIAVSGSNFSVSVTFPAQPAGTLLEYWVWGALSTDPTNWDSEAFFYTTQVCSDSPGPSIPVGFVLRTIVCDVAVFDAPAGNPVGDSHVSAGQTWYVNPKPVKGSDGRSWSAIFVSGYVNPYIPTACVG